LPLEIVPDVSPYAVPKPLVFPVHVLFEGRPLPGALVKLTNLEHDAEPVETHLTDKYGRTEPFPRSGSANALTSVLVREVCFHRFGIVLEVRELDERARQGRPSKSTCTGNTRGFGTA